MREKIKTGFSILIILILLPYVAMVFRTGNPAGSEAKTEEPGLEDFVAGILPGQMSVTYEEEALKAQAVIVRTNLLKKCLEFYGTADMDEAAKADRVVVIDSGKIIADGKPHDVFNEVELLKSVGLDVPQPTELIYKLKKAGVAFDLSVLHTDECVEAISKALED